MSQQIIVLDEAEDELVAAERWYEHRRPGLGSEFRVAIDEAMAQLNAAPQSASPVSTIPPSLGARQIFVKRFPYSVIFIQHESDLWVVAFAHQSRRPGYWRDRLDE